MDTGWFVDGREQRVDPTDRGLAYGDGLFETMAVVEGTVRWLELHLDRLTAGCERLRIPMPDRAGLRGEIESLARVQNRAVIKLIVTRGVGARGYRPPPVITPTRILGVSPWPDYPSRHYTQGIDVQTCTLRLGDTPAIAGLKHLCRLEQVIAQMELERMDAQEGVMLDARDAVIGCTSSNVFAVRGSRLCTPLLDRCGVSGVMRRIVLERAAEFGLTANEAYFKPSTFMTADEVFVTNAVFGIWPVRAWDGTALPLGPKTRALQDLLGYAGA